MGIKELMLDTESEKGKQSYSKMLNWLDSPNRNLFNNSQKLVKGSGIQAGQTVLEIGCGSGFFTVPAAKILGPDGMLYSTDIHSIAIEGTQKKVFDLVLLYGVVPAPVISMEEISREIYRMLKPKGIYAIWTQAPFWTPKVAVQKVPFEKLKKCHGVFQLRKI